MLVRPPNTVATDPLAEALACAAAECDDPAIAEWLSRLAADDSRERPAGEADARDTDQGL